MTELRAKPAPETQRLAATIRTRAGIIEAAIRLGDSAAALEQAQQLRGEANRLLAYIRRNGRPR